MADYPYITVHQNHSLEFNLLISLRGVFFRNTTGITVNIPICLILKIAITFSHQGKKTKQNGAKRYRTNENFWLCISRYTVSLALPVNNYCAAIFIVYRYKYGVHWVSEILCENTLWALKYSTLFNQISVWCNAHYGTSFVESMISGFSVNFLQMK